MLLVDIGKLQGGSDYDPREGKRRQNPVMPVGLVNRKCEKNSPFPYPSIDHRRHMIAKNGHPISQEAQSGSGEWKR